MDISEIYILFCESPIEKSKVDPDFDDEFACAKQNGFKTLLFDFDELIAGGIVRHQRYEIRQNENLGKVIYRGWMLTPHQYNILYDHLLEKNYRLINSVTEYQNCHYLPDSLSFINTKTPHTVFEELVNDQSIKRLLEKAKTFGDKAVIIKDYVKSEKHYWNTACFVENASDTDKLKKIINNFIQLRGKYLNVGLVIREFLDLNYLQNHSKSEMHLMEEYRLFFLNKNLVDIYEYWGEGEYLLPKPDIKEFEEIAQSVESNFFSMDIARKKSGELVIIEIGDGQVSGLPERANKFEFYEKLKSYLE
jgi:hypothetical protein